MTNINIYIKYSNLKFDSETETKVIFVERNRDSRIERNKIKFISFSKTKLLYDFKLNETTEIAKKKKNKNKNCKS